MARQHDLAMASGGKIKSLHDTLKEGMLLLFEDEDLNIDASIFIDRLTIKEEGAAPTYEVVLKEEKTVGRLDKMQNQIDSLVAGKGQGGGGYTAAQIRSMIDAYGGARFLSKIKDDRTPYKVSTDKAFEVGKYLAGVSGGIFGMDADGDSFAEVARLYVRVRAFFEELTIIKAGVLAGKQYITPGGGIRCTRVEEVTDEGGGLTAYRCWFLSGQDGENTECMYSSGDQAISEMFNAVAGTSNKVSNHRYWRLVTAVNNDAYTDGSGNRYGYIDLSATDCEPGSDTPQEGDEICQLGSRNDKTRQTAMVFSTVDADAPSVKLYSGIDSYSLAGKAVVSFGRDPITGRIFFRLGADGDRQYLRYSQDGGLEVAGKISSKSTYDDGSGSDATLGDVINDRIADTDILFISHTSQTVAPALPLLDADGGIALMNGWTTDAPEVQPGRYIWHTTYVLRGDGTAYFTPAVCISGGTGSGLKTGIRPASAEDWTLADLQRFAANDGEKWSVMNATDFNIGDTCVLNLVIKDLDNTPCQYFGVVMSIEPRTPTSYAHLLLKDQRFIYGHPGSNYTENLLTGTRDFTGEWNHLDRGTVTSDTYKGCRVFETTRQWGGTSKPVHLEPGTYTFSAYARVSSQEQVNIYLNDAYNTQPVIGTEWQRVRLVFKVDTAGSYIPRIEKHLATSTVLYMAGYKVEEGDNPSPVWSPAPSEQVGQSAKTVIVNSDATAFMYEDNFNKLTGPNTINLTATLQGTTGYQWSYKTPSMAAFVDMQGMTSATYSLPPTASGWGSDKSMTLRCTSGGVHDEVTIAKVSSGAKGANGSNFTENLLYESNTSLNGNGSLVLFSSKTLGQIGVGKKITVSFDYEYSDVTTGSTFNTYRMGMEIHLKTDTGGDIWFGAWKVLPMNSSGLSEKGRFSRVLVIPENLSESSLNFETFHFHMQLAGGEHTISNFKVEEGDNPSPVWTPNSAEMLGTDAYTVLLTNESHTFAGDSEKAVASSTDCGIVAYKGATQVAATIGAISGMPSGMTAAVSGNGTASARFTVSVTTALTQRQGTLDVPVTVDGKTFTKKFSWSLSLEGKGAHSISVRSFGYGSASTGGAGHVKVDGTDILGPTGRGVTVLTIDRTTLKKVGQATFDLWEGAPGIASERNNFILNIREIPDSMFVCMVMRDTVNWTRPMVDAMRTLGSSGDIDTSDTHRTFAFIGHKGLPPGYALQMQGENLGTPPAEVSAYVANGMFTTSKTQNGVKSITEEYYLSTSRDTPTGGSWSATRPAWVAGRFYWTRVKITYTDGTTEYKGAICATGEAGPGYTSNMLTGTKDWSGWRIDSNYSRSGTYLGLDVMHGTSPSSGYKDLVLVGKTDLEADTVYTLSVWAKGIGSFTTYVYENVTAQILNIDGTVSSSSASNTEARHLLTSQWKRYYVVFRTIAGVSITGKHVLAARLFADGSEIWVAGAKLEKGENHSTQWSPYPSEQTGTDATFSPNLVPSIIYDPDLKGGGSTNAVKWIRQAWSDSTSNRLRIDLIGRPIRTAGWYSVYFMARRVSGAGAMSVDINDNGIAITPSLSTIDSTWRAFSGKVYVSNHIGVNGFIDFENGDGIELSDITVTRGEAVPTSWHPTTPELNGGNDNLLLRSDVEVSNAGYPIASYRIAETLNENEMLSCTIWGDLKGGANRWGVYNSSGNYRLKDLFRVADGVYSAVFKWVTNTDTKNDTLVVYPLGRTDTSAVSTIHRIKLERGTIPTPWSRSSHDFDFITAAMKQDTEVIGGLILSALMKLGVKDASGVRRIMAGINGLVNSSDDLALWAGGDMVDADKFPNDPDRAAAAIRHNGTAYFARNVIRMLSDYMMVGDNVRLDKDGLKLMVDGDTSLEITNRDVYTDFNKLASNQTRFSYNARIGPSIGVESGNSVIVEETYDAVSLGKIEAGTQVVVNIALEGVQDSRNFGNGSVNSPFSQPLTVIAHCGSTAVHQTTMPVHSMTVTHNDAYGRPSWSEHTYRIIGTTTFTASRTGTYEIEITFLKESSAARLGWFSLEGTMSGAVKLALSNQVTIGRNGLSVIRNNNALAINDSMIVMRSDRFGFALHPTLGPVITLNSGTNWYAAQLSGSQILFNKRVSL
ncbi:interleukin-like EMT inducer domain-containing protein [uncultured Duncaniella sp.]|uniref:interleukin-like EMT inducer domain-containing protein n=1 Tax=uncultured Duncaniella sp. TaxID=2768039 RepID=UPI0025AA24BD|nr:interleukin-like EMT inducer domain-containing protein [uncultured Duncaniella sp.]